MRNELSSSEVIKIRQVRRAGRLFVVTLVLATCFVAFASTQKITQASIINSHGQSLPSLFSGWPVSNRGLYILAHKKDPPLASCTLSKLKMPQLQSAVWNPKDKPRLMRAQYGGCYGNYMSLQTNFFTISTIIPATGKASTLGQEILTPAI